MTSTPEPLDDWEGRLAAMASGVRYKSPIKKLRQRSSAPAAGKTPKNTATTGSAQSMQPEDDLQTFLAEQCPCDQCELRQQCASGQLACERYALFMQGQPPARWREVPATPTRERFDRCLAGSID
jgi:hypothetical protein